MRPSEVVVLQPGGELGIAFWRVGVVAGVSPFAQGRLDKAFGFAVGAGGKAE
jgi:hypothetical protein